MTVVPLLGGLAAMAQATPAAAPVAAAANDSVSLMWWLIIGVMAVLLIAVMLLGNVLVNVAKVVAAKNKVAAVIALLLVSSVAFAQDAAPAATAPAESSGFMDWNLIMAGVVMLALLTSVVVLLLRIRRMLSELQPAEAGATAEPAGPTFMDNFNASVSLEKEKDILLDHNYDGIKELDNNLPPWWKYSFYISIVWAIAYLAYYHIGGGPSSHDEFVAEMEKGKAEVAAYIKAHPAKVDENSVTMADAAGIAEGKTIFITNCKPCHGENGEGIVGPNLTDDYWIHGGSMSEVFKSVKYGWPAKGMKSWEADLKPEEIKNVVSYIKTIHGTNPANAKAAEGTLYVEGGAATTSATDSTAAVSSDSASTAAK
ncbi:MAG: cbb3-type cytochrome c oxidase N-terminal domain-containing protein [Chitinophagales bacterium]